MIIFMLFLGLTTFISAIELVVRQNYGWAPFFLWIFAIFIFIKISFRIFPPLVNGQNNLPLFKFDRILSLIIFIAFGFRLILLTNVNNSYFHGDEAIISKNALDALELGLKSGKWELLGSVDGTISRFPGLYYYLQGSFIKFFGPSILSLKLFSLITDLSIIFIVYQIMIMFFSRQLSLITVLIYSSLPIAIHFSTTGYQNIQSTFFLLLTLFFLVKAIHNHNLRLVFISGIVCGLGMYFYLSSVINPLIAVLFSLIISVSFIPVFLAGFLITSGPFLTYSIFGYNFVSGRSSAYDFWFSQKLPLEFVIQQTQKFFSGFYFQPMNGSGLFYVDLPAIPNLIVLIFFLLGLFWLIFNLKKPLSLLLLSIFILTSIFGGILTINPPAPQRFIHLFPVIAIIISLGVHSLSDIFKHRILIWLLSFIVVIFNIKSYLTQNLPIYRNLRRNEYLVSQILPQKPITLFTHIPAHKNPQLFFYSFGKISPIPTSQLDISPQILGTSTDDRTPFYLLTDDNGLVQGSAYKLISEWSDDKKLFLFKKIK